MACDMPPAQHPVEAELVAEGCDQFIQRVLAFRFDEALLELPMVISDIEKWLLSRIPLALSSR